MKRPLNDKQYTQEQYDVYAGMEFNNMSLIEYGEYVKPEYRSTWSGLSHDDIDEIAWRQEEYGINNHLESYDMDDIAERHDGDYCYALN